MNADEPGIHRKDAKYAKKTITGYTGSLPCEGMNGRDGVIDASGPETQDLFFFAYLAPLR